MGCCGSRKQGNYEALETVEVVNESSASCGTLHEDEDKFFHLFFLAMDNRRGYQGILRRWERAAQHAKHTGRYVNWKEIWQKAGGYIDTLERIRSLVKDNDLSVYEWRNLRELSKLVVMHRKEEYAVAEAKSTANHGHCVALQTWQKLDRELQGLG